MDQTRLDTGFVLHQILSVGENRLLSREDRARRKAYNQVKKALLNCVPHD